MIEWLSFWGSWAAGVLLLCMTAFGIRAFLPRAIYGSSKPSRILALAIVIGFLGAGSNTLYWQVWGQLALSQGWTDVATLRGIGGLLDVAFKGFPALAIWLHLAAWRASLPTDERKKWSVLGMTFYPNAQHFFAVALNGFRKSRREK